MGWILLNLSWWAWPKPSLTEFGSYQRLQSCVPPTANVCWQLVVTLSKSKTVLQSGVATCIAMHWTFSVDAEVKNGIFIGWCWKLLHNYRKNHYVICQVFYLQNILGQKIASECNFKMNFHPTFKIKRFLKITFQKPQKPVYTQELTIILNRFIQFRVGGWQLIIKTATLKDLVLTTLLNPSNIGLRK